MSDKVAGPGDAPLFSGKAGQGSDEAGLILLYIPCPDLATAKAIAAEAVKVRLAACANILPQMLSVYRWEGAIEEETEALLLLKTVPEAEAALRAKVEELHPYEVPAVLSLEAVRVNVPYLEWAREELSG